MLRLNSKIPSTFIRPTRLILNLHKFARCFSVQNDEKMAVPSVSGLPLIRLNDDKTGAAMTVPGLTINDIDRAGYMSIWKAARVGESGRITFCSQKPYNQLIEDRLMFLLSCQYEFQPAFFNRSHYHNPIEIESQLVNIGTSSYAYLDRYRSERTSELLWTGFIQMVSVGKQSRRPEAMPDAVRAIFDGKNTKVDREKVSPTTRPVNTHSIHHEVQWSDADAYNHSNHASYLKFCHDAATVLMKKGVFAKFGGDLAFQRVEKCSCLYLGETVPGQVVLVHVWEDPNEECRLHFDIDNNGDSVFQCSLLFFRPPFSFK